MRKREKETIDAHRNKKNYKQSRSSIVLLTRNILNFLMSLISSIYTSPNGILSWLIIIIFVVVSPRYIRRPSSESR